MASPSEKDMDLAEQHYRTGASAYEAQRWDLAAIEFLAAYAISHQPELLYNLSLTAEHAGYLQRVRHQTVWDEVLLC